MGLISLGSLIGFCEVFYRVLGSTRYVGEFIAHKTHKLIKLFIGFVLTCVFTMCKSGCACMRMRSSN